MTLGDESAFRLFYDTYYERLSRYLLVVTNGDDGATSEALHGMLVRLVKHVRIFSDENIFWSWLTVLSRSALADHTRARRRYLAFLDRFRAQAVSASELPRQENTDRLIEILDARLHQLPELERKLIKLKYYEHLSVRAIAVQVKLSEKSVESSLVRIRLKLKQLVLSELKNDRPL